MSYRTLIFAACLMVAWHCAAPQAGCAQPPGDAVEEGRQALEEAGGFPWYDEESDTLRRIDVEPTPPPPPPQQKSGGTRPAAARPGINWTPFLVFLRWTILILLAAGLVAIVIYAIRHVVGGAAMAGGEESQHKNLQSEIDRIEKLPFRVRKPFSDLLSEARRCYEEGNFNEAIIYLFSYQLVHLDKRHLIRLAKGKTNRQYVREVKPSGDISGLLAHTMLAFEEVFFGNHDLPRPRFESCWNKLDEFHSLVDQHTAA